MDYILWQLIRYLFSRNAWKRAVKRVWYPWRKWGAWDIDERSLWQDCQSDPACFKGIVIKGDAEALPTYYGLESLMAHFFWTKICIVQFESECKIAVAVLRDGDRMRYRYVYPKQRKVAFLSRHEKYPIYFTTPGYVKPVMKPRITGDISILHDPDHRGTPLY
ncbi:MAG: hypothetical protein PHT88_05040 [Candidatus Moranbacteria bacterium]|nr:hypothetical protein [Candidatus Moranbacteria bacterium]